MINATTRAILASFALTALLPAHAAEYPAKPVQLIVGYAPGGGTDRLGRIFGNALSQELGVSVIVENKTGATGTIAANYVAKSAPDGYTLLFSAGSDVTLVKHTIPNLPYKIYHDFTPIGRVAQTPYVLITNNQVPGTSVKDLIEYIKQQRQPPAIAAAATISRFSADLFSKRSGLPMETVLYGGSTTPMKDLIGNELQISVDVLPSVLPQLATEKIKARAVISRQRSPLMPNVPTLGESGFPNFVSTVWYSVLAAPGTPDAIADKLNDALRKVMERKEVQESMFKQGYEAYLGDSRKAFTQFLDEETKYWDVVVKETNYQP